MKKNKIVLKIYIYKIDKENKENDDNEDDGEIKIKIRPYVCLPKRKFIKQISDKKTIKRLKGNITDSEDGDIIGKTRPYVYTPRSVEMSDGKNNKIIEWNDIEEDKENNNIHVKAAKKNRN